MRKTELFELIKIVSSYQHPLKAEIKERVVAGVNKVSRTNKKRNYNQYGGNPRTGFYG